MGTVLVIGVGSENGVGGAVCRRFAREGLDVVVAGFLDLWKVADDFVQRRRSDEVGYDEEREWVAVRLRLPERIDVEHSLHA